MWSQALGVADVLYTWASWQMTPGSHRFFSQGYGDINRFRLLRERLIQSWIDGPEDGPSGLLLGYGPARMIWKQASGGAPRSLAASPEASGGQSDGTSIPGPPEASDSHFTVHDASFTSPLAEHMPEESKQVHVRMVVPKGPVEGIVIFTAATNDEDFDMRQASLAEPLINHNIASLMMIVPFYGQRRPAGQVQSKMATVTEFLLQNVGVIVEGCAVVEWCRETFPHVPLGISGISWGGSMASVIAATCNRPVACIPCLGSTSPGTMVSGIIRWQLDWEALMLENKQSMEEAQQALEQEFRSVTLKTILERALRAEPAKFRQGKIRTLVQVQGKDDHYVPPEEGEDLYEVLSSRSAEHRLIWLDGGHVTAFAAAETCFAPAIAAAMGSLGHKSPE